MVVSDAHMFPGFLAPVLTQISFQSHQLLFSHASAELRGENTPERNFASTESRTQSTNCVLVFNSMPYNPSFNDPEEEGFENILVNGENVGN